MLFLIILAEKTMPKKPFQLADIFEKNIEAIFLLKSKLGNSPKRITDICQKAGFKHINHDMVNYWHSPRNKYPGIPVYLLPCLEKASGIKREKLRQDIPWR